MRGRKISSAKRVWPVTLARASTLRRGTPITRSSSPLDFGAPTGVIRGSFSFGIGPPECLFAPSPWNLGYRFLVVRNFEHRGFDGFENLQVARAPAQVSGNRFANLISTGVRVLVQDRKSTRLNSSHT